MPSQPVAAPRLRRRPPAAPAADEEERCELCNAPLADDHPHVVDLEGRSMLCACRGCYLLFTPDGAGGRRFRAVPDRYVRVTGSPPEVPVGVAFFMVNSQLGRAVGFYPGPAGATESELPLDAWDGFDQVVPDVEAVLVRDDECFVVPIDVCYELVGRLRQLWRGFDGGRDAHEMLDGFFAEVRGRAG
jgi:hypothetical protein